MRPPLLLLLFVASIGPASAQAFSAAQRNALEHVSALYAITALCPYYHVNYVHLSKMERGVGIRITQPRESAFLKERMPVYARFFIGKYGDQACLAGWALYGTGGSGVRELLYVEE